MLERIFSSSRFLVILIVFSSALSALVLYLVSIHIIVHVIWDLFSALPQNADSGKRLAVRLLKLLDISLIALTFQIIAISLYQLFIKRLTPAQSKFMQVLKIENFHDLKVAILNVAVVILVIFFLEKAVDVRSYLDLLYAGLAIAVMIAAIVFAVKQMGHSQ